MTKTHTSDGAIIDAYKDYLIGKTTLRSIAKRLGVTEHYIHRLSCKTRQVDISIGVFEDRLDLIRAAETKLIEMARLLQVGKGSIKDYRELLLYTSKANAHSNYSVIIPKRLLR